MERFNDCDVKACATEPPKREVFRVIDDGECVLTTLDPYKALTALQAVIEKYDITHCWVDFETLR